MTDRKLDEETAHKEMEIVSKDADKNERLSWRRKEKKMEEFIKKLDPLNEEMLDLIKRKQPILDDIEELRIKMVHECVHPAKMLVHKGDHILCKFCNRKLKVNDGK